MKLLAIGYNTAGTGLTRVMNSVMRRLADRHEIHFLGIGYAGEIVRDRGLTIYPTNPHGGTSSRRGLHPARRQDRERSGRRADAALDPALSWDVITRQFDDLFVSLASK